MPQSTAALRHQAEVLRLLRSPALTPRSGHLVPGRKVWAKKPMAFRHGTGLALEVRQTELWVLMRDGAGQEGWVTAGRVLSMDDRRAWATRGFG